MKNLKFKSIIAILIATNILLGFGFYKFYTNNRNNLLYINTILSSKITTLKHFLKESLYQTNNFLEAEQVHYTEIQDFKEIIQKVNYDLTYLMTLSDYYGFADPAHRNYSDDKRGYSYYLQNASGRFLLNSEMFNESEGGYVRFDEYQLSFLRELNTLLKEFEENLSKVSDETTLNSEDWVEFVRYCIEYLK